MKNKRKNNVTAKNRGVKREKVIVESTEDETLNTESNEFENVKTETAESEPKSEETTETGTIELKSEKREEAESEIADPEPKSEETTETDAVESKSEKLETAESEEVESNTENVETVETDDIEEFSAENYYEVSKETTEDGRPEISELVEDTSEAESEKPEMFDRNEIADEVGTEAADEQESEDTIENQDEDDYIGKKKILYYKVSVQKLLKRRFKKYKKDILENCTPQEIFDRAFEINAYTMITDTLLQDDIEYEIFEALWNEGKDILYNLYIAYGDSLDASIRSNEDVLTFLRKYCTEEYPKIMHTDVYNLVL